MNECLNCNFIFDTDAQLAKHRCIAKDVRSEPSSPVRGRFLPLFLFALLLIECISYFPGSDQSLERSVILNESICPLKSALVHLFPFFLSNIPFHTLFSLPSHNLCIFIPCIV
jgi:hypothetical protein